MMLGLSNLQICFREEPGFSSAALKHNSFDMSVKEKTQGLFRACELKERLQRSHNCIPIKTEQCVAERALELGCAKQAAYTGFKAAVLSGNDASAAQGTKPYEADKRNMNSPLKEPDETRSCLCVLTREGCCEAKQIEDRSVGGV